MRGNKDDWSSTSDFVVFIDKNPVSWCSRKQRFIVQSSTEVEHRVVASATVEFCRIINLFRELFVSMDDVPALFGDNLGATYLCANPVFHSRIKHIEIEYHFVRLIIQSKVLCVVHISSGDQLDDLFTKALLHGPFEKKLLQDWCFQTIHHLKEA